MQQVKATYRLSAKAVAKQKQYTLLQVQETGEGAAQSRTWSCAFQFARKNNL